MPVIWRLCLAAGIATLLASRGFGWIGAPELCGPGYGAFGAVLSFEFAPTPAVLDAMFGTAPCRARMVAAMTRAQGWDALAFIPAYAAFLLLGAGAVTRGRALLVAGGLALLGALLDEAEGLVMLVILGELPGRQPQFDLLAAIVHVKFVTLALGTAAIGGLLLARRRVATVPFGVAMIGFASASLAGLAMMPNLWLMSGLTYAWVALLLASALAALRPSLFAGRAALPPAPAPPSA